MIFFQQRPQNRPQAPKARGSQPRPQPPTPIADQRRQPSSRSNFSGKTERPATAFQPPQARQNSAKKWDRNGDGKVDFWETIYKIVDVVMTAVSVPFVVLGRILENFTDREKSGIKAIGGALFVFGVLLSADSIYQNFSGGVALFPWFEDRWISSGWFTVWLTVPFWCSIVISLGVAMIEGFALRGLDPDKAKKKYDEIKHHEVPKANPNMIDLGERRRQDYKKAGLKERNIFAVVAVIVFAFDIGSTIVSRNPWGSSQFFEILLYNVFTLLAAEAGYLVWLKAQNK